MSDQAEIPEDVLSDGIIEFRKWEFPDQHLVGGLCGKCHNLNTIYQTDPAPNGKKVAGGCNTCQQITTHHTVGCIKITPVKQREEYKRPKEWDEWL